MKARFFRTPTAFRAWLEEHHATETELLVGLFKRGSGKPSITWPESVDEALAFGWIDGIRRSVDAESYTIRFTPRKPRSFWSAVNVNRVNELKAAGRMTPAGLAAFEKRDEQRTAVYSYERAAATLDAAATKAIKADNAAWQFYESQAPSYKRTSAHWVVSAKRPETRAKRLATLIESSRRGERIPSLAPFKNPSS